MPGAPKLPAPPAVAGRKGMPIKVVTSGVSGAPVSPEGASNPEVENGSAASAADGAVFEDRADDVDFLPVVDLIPERLQDLADRRRVRVSPVHQPRDVFETDVAGLQLLVIQHAYAPVPRDGVAVEREVHFLDAMPFGAGAEFRFGPRRAAAEQDARPWPDSSSLCLHHFEL